MTFHARHLRIVLAGVAAVTMTVGYFVYQVIAANTVSRREAGGGECCEVGSDDLSPIAELPAGPSSDVRARNGHPHRPRRPCDTSAYGLASTSVRPWKPDASLVEIRDAWLAIPAQIVTSIAPSLDPARPVDDVTVENLITRATLFNYEGDARKAYRLLERTRSTIEAVPELERKWLLTIVYFQGVTAMRCGENDRIETETSISSSNWVARSMVTSTTTRSSRIRVRGTTR